MVSVEWQELIEKKRACRLRLIPKDWCLPEATLRKVSPESSTGAFELLQESTILTLREMEITENYDATLASSSRWQPKRSLLMM